MSLIVTYVGGPTLLLEFSGVRLLTDPTFDPAGGEYRRGPVTLEKTGGPAVGLDAIAPIDYVLLSHDHHFDNLDHAGRTALTTAQSVLTTEEGAQRLGGNSIGLKTWDHCDLALQNGGTLRVVATPARHGPHGINRGEVTGFVLFPVKSPEKVVYVSGDTVWYEGVADIARRFKIRVAILHMGAARVPAVGAFHLTMTAYEGVEFARVFSKATIVPVHFEGWAHFTEDRHQIAREFDQSGLAQRLRWPEPGRTIRIDLT